MMIKKQRDDKNWGNAKKKKKKGKNWIKNEDNL